MKKQDIKILLQMGYSRKEIKKITPSELFLIRGTVGYYRASVQLDILKFVQTLARASTKSLYKITSV